MDPRERLRIALRRSGCTRCGRPYAADGITILAQRDDIAFVQLECDRCGTGILALVTGSSLDIDLDADAEDTDWAANQDLEPDRRETAGAVTADDVNAMHDFLSGYYGDLRSLLGGDGAAGR